MAIGSDISFNSAQRLVFSESVRFRVMVFNATFNNISVMFPVQTPLKRVVLDTTLYDKVCR